MRKGWNTPEQHVEAMVLIHNKLNEDAWGEVLRWESRYGGGASEAAKLELCEFAGIHGTVSHKAWLYQRARSYFPTYLTFSPPFDRHDWVIRRPLTNKKVRYVIDYYAIRPSLVGDPEFHLDVRPAMDSLGNVIVRLLDVIQRIPFGVTRLSSSLPTSRIYSAKNSVILGLFVPLALTALVAVFQWIYSQYTLIFGTI